MTHRMDKIKQAASDAQAEAVEFLRDLIRIPSPSGGEGPVVGFIRERMLSLGFDEARIDGFGNVLGRIGRGRRVLALDAHVDTVGVGDSRLWAVEPFAAELRDGVVYGRGASDQKGGMAAIVYAGALIKKLGLTNDTTVYVVGSVFEEDCDGLCWSYLIREKIVEPDLVVITEPTNLQVYRGQRGRMEITLTTRGVSCHGSAPERGVNAVYRMAPLISEIERLGAKMTPNPFLGPGSITISSISSTSPSLCAVADSCQVYLDRRLTAGETEESALAELQAMADRVGVPVELSVPDFREPSHTGLIYPTRKVYPAWVMPEDHAYVRMGLKARELALGEAGVAGKWTFSTNGVATCGRHGVPTIGFGPANEIYAHAPNDQCPAAGIGAAISFYLNLAVLFDREEIGERR